MLATGALIGVAFLAKMGQALLVVPAYGLVYLLAAPTGLRRRARGARSAGLRVLVQRGWWVAIVALLARRLATLHRRLARQQHPQPDLRLQRLRADLRQRRAEPAAAVAAVAARASAARPGPLRLFNDLMGGQASWLLPAALIALLAGLW